MAATFENRAAWQKAAHDKAFVVEAGPDQTKPADDEVVIKVAYVAINPSEWKMQDYAYLPLPYPTVLGSDAAGQVVLTGSKVTKFKPGDRVIGHCLGLIHGGARHGAFQLYTTFRDSVVAKIPDNISLSKAVVLPLALSTAITGLFDPQTLKLRLPSLHPRPSGEVVVIWGASSSVGSVAVQLAKAAGYEVVTTASAHNQGYAKDLGADKVFDYNEPNAVQEILEYLSGKKFVGVLDCIGEERVQRACAEILHALGGGVLPTVLWPVEGMPEDVKAGLVWAANPGMAEDYVAGDVWSKFVPKALAESVLLPKPEAQIVAGGLDKVQSAMDLQKKGVSAKKIVVEMDASIEL